ncbi:hypothetical protein [Micromonospora sp. NPDC023644]|uniref:hypothetical protein n=1 Tax=Micromonospora sp. NPDC023644 TaxID=3154321 RepID=UPI0033C481B8
MTQPTSSAHALPSGPRKQITALDPDSPAGQAAAESLSQALAEILLAVKRRRQAGTAADAA